METFSKGNFVVKDGQILINDQPVSKVLSDKILRFSNENLPYLPLVKFAENLQANPSFRAVNELYSFLEKNDHPITENGNFIAYKRVRGNFKDIYSGTFDNSVGTVVSVPRNQVDENSDITCSHGLHVANWDYAHTKFASSDSNTDVMLEVEVNPKDVVAIPRDYNNSKIRVCSYKVLGVVDKEHSSDVQLRVTQPVKQDTFCTSYSDDKSSDDSNRCEVCHCQLCRSELKFNICEDCKELEDECPICEQTDCVDEECLYEKDDSYPYEDELDE